MPSDARKADYDLYKGAQREIRYRRKNAIWRGRGDYRSKLMQIIILLIKCHNCSSRNRVTLPSKGHQNPVCGKCKHELFDCHIFSGFVYVLTNESMPGLVKIGQTQKGIRRRVKELSASTGVPTPFQVNALFASKDPPSDERAAHASLAEYRTSGREFFRLSPDDAVIAVTELLGRPPIFDSEAHGHLDSFTLDLD